MAEAGDPTGWATYLFNAQAGTYALWGRVQSVMSGSTTYQGCNVQMDSSSTLFQWTMSWPPLFASSFMDYPHGWVKATDFTFTTTGQHNLTIYTRMKYGTIDKFVLQDPNLNGLAYYDLGGTASNIPTGKCQTAYFEAEYGDSTGLNIIGSADASMEGAVYKTSNSSVCTTSTSSTALRFSLNFADPSVFRAIWLRMLAPSTANNEVYVITTGTCDSSAVLTATPSPEYQWVRLYKPLSVINEYRLYLSPKEPYVYIDKVFIGYADKPDDTVVAPLPTTPTSCTKNGLCDPVTTCSFNTSVTCSACPFGYSTASGSCPQVWSCPPNGCQRIVPFGCFFDRRAAMSALSSEMSFPTTAITLEMWVQPMMELLTQDHNIFSYVSSYANSEFHFRYNPTKGLFLVIDGYTWRPTNNLYLSKKNMWYHIAVSWDRTNSVIRIYLNGALKHTWRYTGTLVLYSPGKMSLGKVMSYGSPYPYTDGTEPAFSVDELHIWSNAVDNTVFDDYFNHTITNTTKPTDLKYSFSFGTATDMFGVGVSVCPSESTDTFDASAKFVIRPSEAIALRNFYYATHGGNWTEATNWLWGNPCNGSTPVWFGIDCNSQGRVKTINLPYNNLVGKFPEVAANQKFFTSLTSLELLILHNNVISGGIPDDIGFLTSAKSMFLHDNKLSSIPSSFSQLSLLEELFLQNNILSGQVPEIFSTMAKLTYLYLSSNSLSGAVPTSLGASNIRFLDLSKNSLSGTLPKEIVNSQIYSIDLSKNLLSGVIPDRKPTNDSNMIQMAFSGNSFRCMMPPFMRVGTLKFKVDVNGSIFFCPTNDASAAVVNEKCESVNIYSLTPSSWNVTGGFSSVVATLNVSAVHQCSGLKLELIGIGIITPFQVTENSIKFYLPAATTGVYPLRVKWFGDFYNNSYVSSNMVDLTYYKPCPSNCVRPYGVCTGISGYCQCNTTWAGVDCHSKACPGMCNSHGYCNGTNGACQCYDPYFGVSCSAARQNCSSLNYCSGHGQCDIYKGNCACYLGYWGADCSNKTCPPFNPPFCSHGSCNGTSGTCLCSTGWAGDSCDKPAKSCPNNCTSTLQGQCDAVTGVCVCFTRLGLKYGGSDCSQIICTPNCTAGHGSCINSTCVCNSGWAGADCSIPYILCPNNCSGNGNCDYRYGNCTCGYGYTGANCSLLVCPGVPECNSPHGSCNTTSGECICYDDRYASGEYYSGFRCQYHNFMCQGTPPCSNNGFCDKSNGKCTCSYPFDVIKAPDCSIADCPNNCSEHGVCDTSTGLCLCSKQYNTTADCAYLYIACTGPCNQGYCDISRGVCVCNMGWADSNITNTSHCDFKTCPANCNSKGACLNGTCDCDGGWTGSSCAISNISCPENCNPPNGYCTTEGTCFCYGNFYGDSCAERSCYSGCSGHGTCNGTTGICLCDPGFELPDCYANLCSLHNYCTSSKRGSCDTLSGICNCNYPYFGDGCEMTFCPYNCSGHGTCFYTNGTCVCESDYIGSGCETFSKACPPSRANQCNGNGHCDNMVGVCSCQTGFFGPECNQRWCPNNCSYHGSCNYTTGACTCDPGWNDPTDITCSQKYMDCLDYNCSGNGFCNKYVGTTHGTCYCYAGYYGPSCEYKACPPRCDEHGTCNMTTGNCVCDEWWNGTACLEPTMPCPNDCTPPHGTCNHLTGICICSVPYETPDCQYAPCFLNCSGAHGTCIRENGTCSCAQYYSGAGCQIANLPCNPPCTSHGTCDPNTGKCVCSGGFRGATCDNKTCPGSTPCSGHGTCDYSTGLCSCPDPQWQGEACQIPNLPCPGNCSSSTQGLCNVQTGTCACRYPFFGPSCSNIRCPNDCRGNGFCDNTTGICQCSGRHLPPDCYFSYCEYNCSNHGTCNPFSGTCSCSPRDTWGGEWCDLLLCPNNCSNVGTCDHTTGACNCQIGTTGDGCEKENWWVIVVAAGGGALVLGAGSIAGFLTVRQLRIQHAKKLRAAHSSKYASAEMGPYSGGH